MLWLPSGGHQVGLKNLYQRNLTKICLEVSLRALTVSTCVQCWRMVRALRSHGRCWLVSSDEMSLCTPLVLELPLWLTVGWSWLVNRAVRPERSLRLLSNVYFCGVVDNNNGWPLKRPSSSTIGSLHDITGSFASCCKSHRLSTRLRLLHYVVLLTRLQCVV